MLRDFVIAHVVLCVLFFLISLRKRDMRLVYKVSMVFFMPVAGIILFVLLAIARKFTKTKDTQLILDLADDFVSDGVGAIRNINYQSEVDIVSIEDALMVNSDSVKRKVIFDIFKEDALSYMAYLEKALDNSDTETSHYAAAAVLDIQRKFMLSLQEFSVKFESSKDNLDILLPYSEVIKNYLSSSLIDAKSQKKYKNIYSQVLDHILKVKPDKRYYVDKINCDIELSEYVRVKEYCSKFLQMYPDIEEPYLMFMKYYYMMNDSDGFKNSLTSLKKSNAKFSHTALGMVRYWWGV